MSISSTRRLPIFLCFLLLCQSSSLAAYVGRWSQFGVRPLAMGNTFTAVSDDFNALFYNPAGLARLKTWHEEVINPFVEISKQTDTLINSVSDANLGGGLTSDLTFLKTQLGIEQHLALGFTPYLIFPDVGFGIGEYFGADFIFHGNPELDVNIGNSIVAPLSFARNFFQDRLSLGISMKYRNEIGVSGSLGLDALSAADDANDKTTLEQEFVYSGTGYGVDVGVLFTPSKKHEPTFAISLIDVGNTSFDKASVGGIEVSAPSPKPFTINTGLSFKPYLTDRSYILLAMDAQGINLPVHYSHKLTFGMEWGYSSFIKIQGGIQDGLPTTGFQLDFTLLKLRFASYSIDSSPVVGEIPALVDQRYALQFKFLI